MNHDRLGAAIAAIDKANGEDPNVEICGGRQFPKELLYSLRMSQWLERLIPDPSDSLRLAARAQHIRRWMVPRSDYPAGREGYLRWRAFLYEFHGEQVQTILRRFDYDEETIAQVRKMVGKQGIKRDENVQIIEDVACLTFLEHYFPQFANRYDEDKLIVIVRKTWRKMSTRGQRAARSVEFPDPLRSVMEKALNPEGAS